MEGHADPVDSSDSEAHLPPQQRKKRQRFKRHRGRRQRRRLRELQAQLDGEREAEEQEQSMLCKLGLEACFATTAADPGFPSEAIAAALPNEVPAPQLATWPAFDPEDGEPVCRTPSPPDSPRQQLLPMFWPGQPAPLQPFINVVYVEVPSGDGNFRCFMPQQVVSCTQWSGYSFEDHGEQYTAPSNPEPVMTEPSNWALESELQPDVMHTSSSGLLGSSSDTSTPLVHEPSSEERHGAGTTASFGLDVTPVTKEQEGSSVDNQKADSWPSLETASSHLKSSPKAVTPPSWLGEQEETNKIIDPKWQDEVPAAPTSTSSPDSSKASHLKTHRLPECQCVEEHEEKTCEMYKQGACGGGSDACTARRQSVHTPQSRRAHPGRSWTQLVLVAVAVAGMMLVAVGGSLRAGFSSSASIKSNSAAAPSCAAEGSPRQLAEASVEAFEPGGRSVSSTHSMKLSAPVVVIPMEAGPVFEPSKAKESPVDQSSWTTGFSSIQQYADFPAATRPSQMKLSEPVVLISEARWNNSPLRVQDD